MSHEYPADSRKSPVRRVAHVALVTLSVGALTLSSVADSFAQRGGFGGGRSFGGDGMRSPGMGSRMPGNDGPRYPGGGRGPRFPGGGGGIMLPPGGFGSGGPGTVVVVDDDDDPAPKQRRRVKQAAKKQKNNQTPETAKADRAARRIQRAARGRRPLRDQ